MLLRLGKHLDPVDNLLVVFALDGNRNGQAAHHECGRDAVILRETLQVGHIESGGRLVEDFGEVLCHEPVQTLQRAESEDPIV